MQMNLSPNSDEIIKKTCQSYLQEYKLPDNKLPNNKAAIISDSIAYLSQIFNYNLGKKINYIDTNDCHLDLNNYEAEKGLVDCALNAFYELYNNKSYKRLGSPERQQIFKIVNILIASSKNNIKCYWIRKLNELM